MLELTSPSPRRCDGVSRRSFLKVGSLGLTGLTLADVLRARAFAAGGNGTSVSDRSVILIWLDGGPPQHETYDPKPEAPAEYRGPLKAIATALPGVQVSELLPNHARLLDKVSLIRSLHHDNGDHFAAAHWMLTGYLGSNASEHGAAVSVGGLDHRPDQRGEDSRGCRPTSDCRIPTRSGSRLAITVRPISGRRITRSMPTAIPIPTGYRVPNLTLPGGVDSQRMDSRRSLLAALDQTRRAFDASGIAGGFDRFEQDAFSLVLGQAARRAFDLSTEDPRLRDRYSRHQWGQSALLARRLVEAGVRFVTLTFGGWDFHSSLEKGMHRGPAHPGCHGRQPDRGPGQSRLARLDDGDRHGRIRPHARG